MGREADPAPPSKFQRIAEVIGSGGFSLVFKSHEAGNPVEKELVIPKPLTHLTIHEQTGFKRVVEFPEWQTEAAGVVSFHDELDRLGKDLGWQNVIGSTYQDSETGALKLGVFVKESAIPPFGLPGEVDEQ